MKSPTVSVIIPTYNRAHLLPQAIESVLRQTYQDWELIVVDDGSTDATVQVLQEYGQRDHRIRWVSQPNRGSSAARNQGLSLARGGFIAFLDDDDLWLPEKLEVQVMRLQVDPQLGFAYCPMIVHDAQGHREGVKPALSKEDTLEALLWSNFITTSTIIVRRRCFDICGHFDEQLSRTEDYDMWLRIAKVFPFIAIRELLVIYRRHAGNTTTRIGILSYGAHVRIFQKLLSDRGLSPRHHKLVLRRLARELHLLGKTYLMEQRYREALRAFLQEIATNPLAGLGFVNADDRIGERAMKAFKPYLAAGYSWLASLKPS